MRCRTLLLWALDDVRCLIFYNDHLAVGRRQRQGLPHLRAVMARAPPRMMTKHGLLPLPFPFRMSPPCAMKPFSTRWIFDPLYPIPVSPVHRALKFAAVFGTASAFSSMASFPATWSRAIRLRSTKSGTRHVPRSNSIPWRRSLGRWRPSTLQRRWCRQEHILMAHRLIRRCVATIGSHGARRLS